MDSLQQDKNKKDQPDNASLSEKKARISEDFKKLSSAQQATILKKQNPEAFAKLNHEIVARTAIFRKIMHGVTIILGAGIVYYLFF